MSNGEYILIYLSFLLAGSIVLQANSSRWIRFQNRKMNTIKKFLLISIGLLLIAPSVYSQNEAFENQLKNYYKNSLPNIENKIDREFLENEIFKYLSYKILKNKSNDSTSLIDEVTGKLIDGSEFKFSYSYNQNGNQAVTIYATWDGSQWLSSYQITYTYDSDGKSTSLLYETWDGSQWENAIQLTNTYDSNGNQTLYLLETWDGSQWVNNSQTIFTYDSNGNETLSILERWDGSQWEKSFQVINTYNSNGNQILSIIQTWNGSQFVNNSQTKNTYDSNGNQIISLNETWNGSQFVSVRQTKNTFDSNRNLTLSLIQLWDGSQFANNSQTKNTYDSNENQTLSLIETWDGSQWVNNSRIIFTYDSNENMILGLSEKFESNNWVATNGSIRFEDSFGRTESYFASEINVTYLILDVEVPVITHTPIQQAEANQAITITANITDNSQIASAQLFYRKAGESNFIILNMTANGNSYSSNIPSSEVTLAGIEYFIRAADVSGNEIREPASGVFSIQVSIEDVVAPVITHTPIQQATANQPITIAANITDNGQVSNAQMFYSKAGESNFITLNMTANGSVYSSDIPSSEVTLAGLEYFIRAADTSGNEKREPASGVFSIQVSIEDVEAPVIIHTPIQLATADQPITITANITDNGQVSNAQMFYRKAGESNFISLNMTANGSVYSSDIPSSEVTLAGIEYFMTAADTSGNDIREPASGVFSIQVSIEDVEAPVITHTPIQQTVANQTITITANISDNEQVTNAQLFYRKGGEINFKSLTLEASGNTFSGEIPINEVTLRGLEYFLTSTDALNNSSRDPTNGVIALQVSVSGEGLVKETAQPSGSAQTAYRLISFPLDIENKNSTSIFNDDLGNYDKTKWRMFELENAQTYKENSSSLTISPGSAYWLIVKESDKKIDTGPAKSFKSNTSFTISLNAGWTFIGNPFNYSIPTANLSLANSQSFTIEFFSGSWNPFTGQLQPFEGYALHTEQATNLVVNPALSSSILTKSTNEKTSKSLWEINIVASCQNSIDGNNIAAIVPESFKDWDIQDRPEPPVIGEYISLYFPHTDWNKISKTYSKDVRPEFEDGEIWNIEVKTNIDDIVHLSFENVEDVSEDYVIMLIDKKNQTVKDLKKSQEYSFSNSNIETIRKLQLVIGTNEFVNEEIEQVLATPTDYQLFQNYPNPFNPTTNIEFSIPLSGLVSLKVFNLLGQEISVLINKELSAGSYKVDFDASKLTSGIYFYSLQTSDYQNTMKMLLLK